MSERWGIGGRLASLHEIGGHGPGQAGTIRGVSQPGRADLHIHTSFSDGWPSPGAVVDHVAGLGCLDVIAITDHDTIEGALRPPDLPPAPPDRPPAIVAEEAPRLQR